MTKQEEITPFAAFLIKEAIKIIKANNPNSTGSVVEELSKMIEGIDVEKKSNLCLHCPEEVPSDCLMCPECLARWEEVFVKPRAWGKPYKEESV
jgi:hypothetical protein